MSKRKPCVKVTESCLMFVVGIDMNCPLCGLLVRSGEQHECSRPECSQHGKKRGEAIA